MILLYIDFEFQIVNTNAFDCVRLVFLIDYKYVSTFNKKKHG